MILSDRGRKLGHLLKSEILMYFFFYTTARFLANDVIKRCNYERHFFCFQSASRRCVGYPQRSRYHRLSSSAAPEQTDKYPKQANNHSSSFRDEQEPRLSRKSMFTVRGAKLRRHDTAECLRSKSVGSGCTTWHDVTWLSRGLNDAAFTFFFVNQNE